MFDHSLPLGDTLSRVVKDIFLKYNNVLDDGTMPAVNEWAAQATGHRDALEEDTVQEGSVNYNSKSDEDCDDASMSSKCSSDYLPVNLLKVVCFDKSETEESMSVTHFDPDDNDNNDYYFDDDDDTPGAGQRHLPSWRVTKWTPADPDREKTPRGTYGARSNCSKHRCMRCEAYDAHCKSAAENYRRILTSYTKTVSELMIGFKKVLERYPELRVDSSDDHLHYMVQAALGCNNLVQEMVRLAAKRQVQEAVDNTIVSVHKALNMCYTDSEALRMILQHYINLHQSVRSIE